MKELLKMALAITLILLTFYLQGCVTINIKIDQTKSLITAPVEYEEEEYEDEEELVTPVKNTFTKGVSI